jgi:hypothetical protein
MRLPYAAPLLAALALSAAGCAPEGEAADSGAAAPSADVAEAAPATAAAAVPTADAGGGTLPMGRWDCRDEITGPLRTMGFFVLRADGTYRYLDKPENEGRYRFDAETGVIEWLTGPYGKSEGSEDHFRGFFEMNSAGRPVITMRLVSTDVDYADADYCYPAAS